MLGSNPPFRKGFGTVPSRRVEWNPPPHLDKPTVIPFTFKSGLKRWNNDDAGILLERVWDDWDNDNNNANRQGWVQMADTIDRTISPLVAFKTGILRGSFQESLATLREMGRQFSTGRVPITIFDLLDSTLSLIRMIGQVDYAKYHVVEYNFGKRSYDNPHTAGTRPISSEEMKLIFRLELKKAIREYMVAQGWGEEFVRATEDDIDKLVTTGLAGGS